MAAQVDTGAIFLIEKGLLLAGYNACKTKEDCERSIAEKFPKWSKKKVETHVLRCEECVCEDC